MRPALVVPSFPLWALLVSIATLSGERCEYEHPVRFLPASQQAERAQHPSTRACYAVRRRCPRAGRSTPEARRVRCSAITARDTASSLCISDSSVACSTYRILSRSVQDSSSAAQLVRCTRLQQARASVSLCCPVRGIHRVLTRVSTSRVETERSCESREARARSVRHAAWPFPGSASWMGNRRALPLGALHDAPGCLPE